MDFFKSMNNSCRKINSWKSTKIWKILGQPKTFKTYAKAIQTLEKSGTESRLLLFTFFKTTGTLSQFHEHKEANTVIEVA